MADHQRALASILGPSASPTDALAITCARAEAMHKRLMAARSSPVTAGSEVAAKIDAFGRIVSRLIPLAEALRRDEREMFHRVAAGAAATCAAAVGGLRDLSQVGDWPAHRPSA